MSTYELYVLKTVPEDKKDKPTYFIYRCVDGKALAGMATADNAKALGRQFGTNYHSITQTTGTSYSWEMPLEADSNVHPLSLEERTQFKNGFDDAYSGNSRVNPQSRRAAELKRQTL